MTSDSFFVTALYEKQFMDKAYVTHLSTLIIMCLFSVETMAADELYPLIVKKNLFNPQRTEWNMDTAKKSPIIQNKIPRLNPQTIQLFGTIVTGKKRRAVICTSPQHTRANTKFYTIDDYIQGYRIKEITPKQVILSNRDADDELILNLRDGKKKRSYINVKTALPAPPVAQPVKRVVRRKGQTAQDLMKSMERSLNILKQQGSSKNKYVKIQAYRDYNKIKRLFGSMSDEERSAAVKIKQELDKVAQGQ